MLSIDELRADCIDDPTVELPALRGLIDRASGRPVEHHGDRTDAPVSLAPALDRAGW